MIAMALMLIQQQALQAVSIPSSPVVKCDLDLGSWCMVQFEGSVALHQDGGAIQWRLHIKGSPAGDSIDVFEDHACRYRQQDRTWTVERNDGGDGKSNVRLVSGGCTLVFAVPRTSSSTPNYMSLLGDYVMLQGRGGMRPLKELTGFAGK